MLRHALDRPQVFNAAVEAVLKGPRENTSLKVRNMAAALRMGFGYTKARFARLPWHISDRWKPESSSLVALHVAARANLHLVMWAGITQRRRLITPSWPVATSCAGCWTLRTDLGRQAPPHLVIGSPMFLQCELCSCMIGCSKQ